jgi:hypothetical protein
MGVAGMALGCDRQGRNDSMERADELDAGSQEPALCFSDLDLGEVVDPVAVATGEECESEGCLSHAERLKLEACRATAMAECSDQGAQFNEFLQELILTEVMRQPSVKREIAQEIRREFGDACF